MFEIQIQIQKVINYKLEFKIIFQMLFMDKIIPCLIFIINYFFIKIIENLKIFFMFHHSIKMICIIHFMFMNLLQILHFVNSLHCNIIQHFINMDNIKILLMLFQSNILVNL